MASLHYHLNNVRLSVIEFEIEDTRQHFNVLCNIEKIIISWRAHDTVFVGFYADSIFPCRGELAHFHIFMNKFNKVLLQDDRMFFDLGIS